MRFSDRLHRAAAAIWAEYHRHPFVTGIGDGTLSIERFRFFLLQDYLYLYDYAKVFALGVVKATSFEELHFFSRNMDAVLNGEMDTHRAYMKRLGIADHEVAAVTMSLENRAYTHFMLAVGHAGGTPEILAAILACSWSYAEIGRRLAAIPGAITHPFYGEWIESYASFAYQQANDALIERMNAAAERLSPVQLASLEEAFVSCSRFEAGFWQMSWEMSL